MNGDHEGPIGPPRSEEEHARAQRREQLRFRIVTTVMIVVLAGILVITYYLLKTV